jgi:hypothetical protein
VSTAAAQMPRKPMRVTMFGVIRLASTTRRKPRASAERWGAAGWDVVPM